MTLSEAFEGETSSLRKTFDEVVARESKDTWKETLSKIISAILKGNVHVEDRLNGIVGVLIQQEIDKAVKEEKERITEMIAGLEIKTGDGARDFAVKATLAHIINNLK